MGLVILLVCKTCSTQLFHVINTCIKVSFVKINQKFEYFDIILPHSYHFSPCLINNLIVDNLSLQNQGEIFILACHIK